MIHFLKHIASVPLFTLLIVIGLGFAQLHDAVHDAETMLFQHELPAEQAPDSQSDEECLTCVLTVSASSTNSFSFTFDYPSKDTLSVTNQSFSEPTALNHFRLRAPPV